MSVGPCGTFSYKAVIPHDVGDWRGPWACELFEPGDEGLPALLLRPLGRLLSRVERDRLVGYSPVMTLADEAIQSAMLRTRSGLVPIPPDVALRRITLTASGPTNASQSTFSFLVDRALIEALRAGDEFYTAYSGPGTKGLSIIRDGRLFAAAGDVMSVPLGRGVRVHHAEQALEEARRAFQKVDPQFDFPELPVAVSIGDKTSVRFHGELALGPYDVWVEHGRYDWTPGVSPCLAISLRDGAPTYATVATARLLNG